MQFEGNNKIIFDIFGAQLLKKILFINRPIKCQCGQVYLRNAFNFWSVHGIMNTLGLLQNK